MSQCGLKEEGFVRKGKDRAYPDWDRFANEAATRLRIAQGSDAAAVEYLTAHPPKVQTANLTWENAPLAGGKPVERALML